MLSNGLRMVCRVINGKTDSSLARMALLLIRKEIPIYRIGLLLGGTPGSYWYNLARMRMDLRRKVAGARVLTAT